MGTVHAAYTLNKVHPGIRDEQQLKISSELNTQEIKLKLKSKVHIVGSDRDVHGRSYGLCGYELGSTPRDVYFSVL
jgi:hypothetical protein